MYCVITLRFACKYSKDSKHAKVRFLSNNFNRVSNDLEREPQNVIM